MLVEWWMVVVEGGGVVMWWLVVSVCCGCSTGSGGVSGVKTVERWVWVVVW